MDLGFTVRDSDTFHRQPFPSLFSLIFHPLSFCKIPVARQRLAQRGKMCNLDLIQGTTPSSLSDLHLFYQSQLFYTIIMTTGPAGGDSRTDPVPRG